MDIFSALFLGVLQGITEFLPISSSGHLVLAEHFMQLDVEAMKSFDVAVHFGTLLAILIYFRKDFWELIAGSTLWVARKLRIGTKAPRSPAHEIGTAKTHAGGAPHEDSARLSGWIILATVPAVIVGLFFGDYLDANFRNATSVAIMMIIVGVLFFVAEYIAARAVKTGLTMKNTLLIGVAQACALIPGVSRSGATISAGIAQGLSREAAARFSFLLGAVAITAASALSLYQAFKGDIVMPPFDLMSAGIVSSFIAGYAAIAFLMRFLKNHTLHVFGVYRVVVGFIILSFALLS